MSIIIDVPKDEESDSGTVLACGERCTQGLQTGDNVTFGKWSGHSVNMDGEDLLIVREEDIFFEGVAE